MKILQNILKRSTSREFVKIKDLQAEYFLQDTNTFVPQRYVILRNCAQTDDSFSVCKFFFLFFSIQIILFSMLLSCFGLKMIRRKK